MKLPRVSSYRWWADGRRAPLPRSEQAAIRYGAKPLAYMLSWEEGCDGWKEKTKVKGT